MLLSEFKLKVGEPIYKQIKNEIIRMIEEGFLIEGSKLPSTREVSELLNVSRNSCIHAYELLEDEEYIQIITTIEQLNRILKKRRDSYWKTLKKI